MPAGGVSCPCTVRGCRGRMVDRRTAERHATLQRLVMIDAEMVSTQATEHPSSSIPSTPRLSPPAAALPSSPSPALTEEFPEPSVSPPPLQIFPPSSPRPSSSSSSASSSLSLSTVTSDLTEYSVTPPVDSLGESRPTLDPSVLYEGVKLPRGLDPRVPRWLVRLYWLLVSIRSHHGVPIVACERLLRFARDELLPAYGLDVPTPIRFPTLRRRLGLESDQPIRYTVCPRMDCQLLYPPQRVSAFTDCEACGSSLLNTKNKPAVDFFYTPLCQWLRRLARRPDFLTDIGAWRRRSTRSDPTDGSTPRLADIYDGTAWQSEKGFLDGDDGINLLLGLGVDWFQPFGCARSYSAGPIFISVLNLPSSERFSPEYVHLAGITPGPREPSYHTIHSFLEPLVSELRTLYEGITIEIPQYGTDNAAGINSESSSAGATRTLRLRAKLFIFIGDSPARSRVGGFCSIGANDEFCPHCEAKLDQKEDIALGRRTARLRDPAQHRRHSLAVKGLSAAVGTRTAKVTGARYSILHELPYWHSVTSCPVDVMHALYLGMVKRLWRHFLLAYGVVTPRELVVIRLLLANSRIPAILERPPPGLGSPQGGTLTANQLLTLARLLPAFLAGPWFGSIVHYQAHRRQIKQQMAADARIEDDDDARPYWVLADANAATVDPSERRGSLCRHVHRGWIFEEIIVRLSVVVEYLHQKVLAPEEIDFIEQQVHSLVAAIATLPFMTYNTHVLTHVAEQIRRFGPPRAFWAFAVEKHIQVLNRTVPASNKRQVELTMLKTWADRDGVDRSMQDDHKASGSALSVRTRERQRTFDGTILSEALGRRLARGPQTLSKHAYDSMYVALARRYPWVPFAKVTARRAPPNSVPVVNSIKQYDSVSVNGLHFTAQGRKELLTASPTSFAFVRHKERGTGFVRLHPVQIMQIFTHAHRPVAAHATASEPTTATFALCRVFKTAAAPTWFHSPGCKPFARFFRVLLEAEARDAVFPVDSLVASAVVILLGPPSVLFKMIL